ncbi:MAG: DNA ligase, partial [Ottowia sp.]|nr:DNA ligase [Ottowia sp.]
MLNFRPMQRRRFLALPALALLAPCLPATAAAVRPAPPAMELAGAWRSGLKLSEWWVSEKYDGIR